MRDKIKYFRHLFSGRHDTSLVKLISELGLIAYAYYFILLEIYGERRAATSKETVEIHLREISIAWNKRLDACKNILNKMQLNGMLDVTIFNDFVQLRIDNYPKSKSVDKKESTKKVQRKYKESTQKPVSSVEVRDAFKKSYKKRYGIDPVWSVKENVMAINLIRSVGLTEAVSLASYYPSFTDKFHSAKKHPFSLLVSQIDQVRVSLSKGEKSSNPYLEELKSMESSEVFNG